MAEHNKPYCQTREGPEVQPAGRLLRLAHFLERLVVGKQFESDLRASIAGSSGDFAGLNETEKVRAARLFANKPSQMAQKEK